MKNKQTFLGADHRRQHCRLSSVMLPTIVSSGTDNGLHQNITI
ncbi:hypothetical protein [Bacteroides caecigallinarum]|nr:hypothetical protein [Bacteroides caecigallinarum]